MYHKGGPWTQIWEANAKARRTGRPGVMRFMGSQRAGHNWATELNWRAILFTKLSCFQYWSLRNLSNKEVTGWYSRKFLSWYFGKNMLPEFSVVLFITSLNLPYQITFQLKVFLHCVCVCVYKVFKSLSKIYLSSCSVQENFFWLSKSSTSIWQLLANIPIKHLK